MQDHRRDEFSSILVIKLYHHYIFTIWLNSSRKLKEESNNLVCSKTILKASKNKILHLDISIKICYIVLRKYLELI